MPVCFQVYIACKVVLRTPIKRLRNVVAASPGSDEASHALGTKRVKEKTDVPRALPSYTDPDVMDGPASEDIDGIPLGDEDAPPRRSTTIALSSRMLTRRATDVPFSAISEADLYAPSPRSAAFIMANVFGESRSSSDALFVWRRKREELKCPLCLDVLVRPVDVAGCGHYVCRTHVIDMYQHGGSRRGIKCCVCRKEETVEDFDRIEVDKNLWLKIQRAKFHSARRKSASPSRSLTPLRERFNRKFLQDVDF